MESLLWLSTKALHRGCHCAMWTSEWSRKLQKDLGSLYVKLLEARVCLRSTCKDSNFSSSTNRHQSTTRSAWSFLPCLVSWWCTDDLLGSEYVFRTANWVKHDEFGKQLCDVITSIVPEKTPIDLVLDDGRVDQVLHRGYTSFGRLGATQLGPVKVKLHN
jgi:hypothetical protein